MDNLQLDSDYTYSLYRTNFTFSGNPMVGSGVAVTTINGLSGPTLNFDGGTTGYSFIPGGTTIVLTGAATSIRESSGPTALAVGAVADGEFLKRSGATIIGDPSPAGAVLDEVTTTTDLTLTDSNDVVFVDTSGAPVTVTLHDPITAKQKLYEIKLIDASNTLTIDGDGANIDGAATLVVTVLNTNYTLVPDNANGTWSIV